MEQRTRTTDLEARAARDTPLVAPPAEPETDAEAPPRGTMVLMLVFLILLGGIWFYVYQILMARQ